MEFGGIQGALTYDQPGQYRRYRGAAAHLGIRAAPHRTGTGRRAARRAGMPALLGRRTEPWRIALSASAAPVLFDYGDALARRRLRAASCATAAARRRLRVRPGHLGRPGGD